MLSISCKIKGESRNGGQFEILGDHSASCRKLTLHTGGAARALRLSISASLHDTTLTSFSFRSWQAPCTALQVAARLALVSIPAMVHDDYGTQGTTNYFHP